ncbi:carbohydrate ABC transporter permease [Actinocorallia aurea]
MRRRPNYLAGIGSVVWLALIGLPLYVMLAASLQTRTGYAKTGALGVPDDLTLQNYVDLFTGGFRRYFVNTFVVTGAVVAIVLLVVPPLAYAIVRSRGGATTFVFRVFLLGLAIPSQAVLVPMFYLMSEVGLYDSLIGIILPTAAFALPVCTLVICGVMREITTELYEAMAIDGASTWRTFFQLVLPLSKGGLSTITVFSALQAWNGFLFPLVLTQSQESKLITLGLYDFRTQFGMNVPGLLAAVVLSMLPIFIVYLFARRALIQGLMGVGGK